MGATIRQLIAPLVHERPVFGTAPSTASFTDSCSLLVRIPVEERLDGIHEVCVRPDLFNKTCEGEKFAVLSAVYGSKITSVLKRFLFYRLTFRACGSI